MQKKSYNSLGNIINYMIINYKAYVVFSKSSGVYDFYTYDAGLDTWSLIQHYENFENEQYLQEALTGKWFGYHNMGYSLNISSICFFNPSTKLWIKKAAIPNISAGSEAYFIGGSNNQLSTAVLVEWHDPLSYDLWKYNLN
jgi:hypothetical protein